MYKFINVDLPHCPTPLTSATRTAVADQQPLPQPPGNSAVLALADAMATILLSRSSTAKTSAYGELDSARLRLLRMTWLLRGDWPSAAICAPSECRELSVENIGRSTEARLLLASDSRSSIDVRAACSIDARRYSAAVAEC